MYYGDSRRNYTFLHRHEYLPEIFSTTEHENMHAAIDTIRDWELTEVMEDKLLSKHQLHMDDNEEHNMIRIALSPEEYFGE